MLEKVEKLAYVNEKAYMSNKKSDEALIVFNLKNQKKISYIIDILTLREVRKRLCGGILGVLKIGESNKNRVDLNQVNSVFVNSRPLEL